MTTTFAFWAFFLVCSAWLLARAVTDHRRAIAQRRVLLDEAAGLLDDAKITFAPDQFPILIGRLADRRQVKVELIADTLVTRRLPQLWLRATLSEIVELRRPTIGALARPTGAEFYSLVHNMPEQFMPPQTDVPLLMRGDGGITATQIQRASSMFRKLFADPTVKEAVIAPRGTRLVRQACQGDRGAHLVMRQARFPIKTVGVDLVQRALDELQALSETLAMADDPVLADAARTGRTDDAADQLSVDHLLSARSRLRPLSGPSPSSEHLVRMAEKLLARGVWATRQTS
jgi:hypothetical protein